MNYTFDEVAELYKQSRKPLPDFVHEFISRKIEQQSAFAQGRPTRFLDVATGTGALVHDILPMDNLVSIGLDISAGMLAGARTGTSKNPVRFVLGDVHHLPFADRSIDVVSACQSVHLFDPRRFYHELNRVLALQGLFVVVSYDLIASPGSPAQYTNDVFRAILAHDMWPGFSETGVHPDLMNELESNGLVPFETVSREVMFEFDADAWQRRIESSSFTLKIVPERVRRALLDEHYQRARDYFGGGKLQQRQRCWIVVACRLDFVDQVVL